MSFFSLEQSAFPSLFSAYPVLLHPVFCIICSCLPSCILYFLPLLYYMYVSLPQTCRIPGKLESGIPARCDICKQCCSYLQTNHVYLQIMLSSDHNYVKKWILAGSLYSSIPRFLHACSSPFIISSTFTVTPCIDITCVITYQMSCIHPVLSDLHIHYTIYTLYLTCSLHLYYLYTLYYRIISSTFYLHTLYSAVLRLLRQRRVLLQLQL